MSKIAVFLADGFEEIEGLTVVDICRRCDIEVDTVSIKDTTDIMGSHGIPVKADTCLADIQEDAYDMLVLPGGGLGTKNLEACAPLMEIMDRANAAGRKIAAICAAPSIFAHRGYLKGCQGTCYPAFESHLAEGGCTVTGEAATVCGHITTGRGMGASIPFALAVAGELVGRDKAGEIAEKICYKA